MIKTLRLHMPQWQGGVNPYYMIGCELMRQIVPYHQDMTTVDIKVDQSIGLVKEHGIDGEAILIQQMNTTRAVIERYEPEKILVIGGDCSVSQVPFDYLSQKYQETFGIIWLDAHPDVSTTKHSSHLHEMVLNNLISNETVSLAQNVNYPVSAQRVLLAGLIEKDLRDMDHLVFDKNLQYITPQQFCENSNNIIKWIKNNKIQHLAIHFDLDVLSPDDYRSIYPAEPGLLSFGAAIGEMTLNQIAQLFETLSQQTDIVGLTIAEHMPWDAIRLRNTLNKLSIF